MDRVDGRMSLIVDRLFYVHPKESYVICILALVNGECVMGEVDSDSLVNLDLKTASEAAFENAIAKITIHEDN